MQKEPEVYKEKYPIIDVPAAQKKGRYLLERLLAFVSTAVIWILFCRYIINQLVAAEEKTIAMTQNLLLVIAAALGILIYWQVFNIWMYGKKDRRKAFPAQSAAFVAGVYGISTDDLAEIQAAQEVTMRFENEQYFLFPGKRTAPVRLGLQLHK